MDFVAYSAFLKKRAKDFRSIAAKTKGDMTVEDLHGEAWLIAIHLAGKRGEAINWSDRADQSLIFGALTIEHVWRKNKERKQSVSADKEREGHDENASALIALLPAEETSDPLALLERREEEESESAQAKREEEEAILESYSQSAAYIIVLWHFDNIRIRAAAYLVINQGTLRKRVAFAAEALKMQPSLFDRIEKIDETFMPAPGREYATKIERHCAAEQWGWEF
jgi:23S rRNA pseudoU1915 N3-methylase RlmH